MCVCVCVCVSNYSNYETIDNTFDSVAGRNVILWILIKVTTQTVTNLALTPSSTHSNTEDNFGGSVT